MSASRFGAMGSLLRAPITLLTRISRPRVEKNLRAFGLRYDDLLNKHDPDVKAALDMLAPEEALLRKKRLHRAIDLQMKHEELPKELQAVQDPWNHYLRPLVDQARQRRIERETY